MKLDDIEKKNIFQTPDEYFKDLPGIIQSRAVNTQKEGFLPKVMQPATYKYAFASMVIVILLAVGINFVYQPAEVNLDVDYLAMVSDQQLSDYLQEADLDEYDIIEVAYENGIQIIETNTFEITDEIIDTELELVDVESYLF